MKERRKIRYKSAPPWPRTSKPGLAVPGIDKFIKMSAEEFWARVDKVAGKDGCWPWTGGKSKGGYGSIRGRYRAHLLPHRVAFFFETGTDPGAAQVCHTCDNPPCCNPAHLFLGNHEINMADKASKGRARGRFSQSNSPATLNKNNPVI